MSNETSSESEASLCASIAAFTSREDLVVFILSGSFSGLTVNVLRRRVDRCDFQPLLRFQLALQKQKRAVRGGAAPVGGAPRSHQ